MRTLKVLARRTLASPLPYAVLRARALRGRAVTLLTYHTLGADDEDFDAWTVLARGTFERQVDALRRDYEIVPIDEALDDHADENAATARPRVVLTFDDGHSGWTEHLLPLAERLALPVTLYVATGHVQSGRPYWFDAVVNALQTREPIEIDATAAGLGRVVLNRERGERNWLVLSALLEAMKRMPAAAREAMAERLVAEAAGRAKRPFTALRPMTPDEVRALARARGVAIGSHSHGHELLDQLPLAAACESIRHSMALLNGWTGRRIVHFAYPNGNYNAALAAALPGLGLSSAVTTRHGLWRRDGSRYELPRVAVGRFDDGARLRLSLLG
jgi:peptidoglycan/xylan/chitin deacetylase (PgdA/CDA1 family)